MGTIVSKLCPDQSQVNKKETILVKHPAVKTSSTGLEPLDKHVSTGNGATPPRSPTTLRNKAESDGFRTSSDLNIVAELPQKIVKPIPKSKSNGALASSLNTIGFKKL